MAGNPEPCKNQERIDWSRARSVVVIVRTTTTTTTMMTMVMRAMTIMKMTGGMMMSFLVASFSTCQIKLHDQHWLPYIFATTAETVWNIWNFPVVLENDLETRSSRYTLHFFAFCGGKGWEKKNRGIKEKGKRRLITCAEMTCHARREFFVPKLRYFLSFKCI